MDPIDDLRQRMASAAVRDTEAMTRPEPPFGRVIIQPTSMSRVVWRIPTGDEPALRATSERQPRHV
jgi:hypothetical protein